MQPFSCRLIEWAGDRYYGIATRGWLKPTELGLPPGCLSYNPTPYLVFRKVIRHIPSEFISKGTFLDYGSGLGRTLILASRLSFTRVIGVEYSDVLCHGARMNLTIARARNVELICADARTFDIPSDVSVFFMFNPFLGETLKTVIDRIRSHRRPFALAACNYDHFESATPDLHMWLHCVAKGALFNTSWAVYYSAGC